MALFTIAEEEGLLYPLDCLCRRSGLIGAKGLPEGTRLFLNVRPTAIHDPDFRSAALRKTLEVCGLVPNDVVLEISEQESIENFEIFREIRDYYRKLGFRIALDDTGAGYASLEAVVELAPDFIKVDRAFVRGVDEDPSRQELLHALQKVANSLGSSIIAEGLDTLEELATLGDLGDLVVHIVDDLSDLAAPEPWDVIVVVAETAEIESVTHPGTVAHAVDRQGSSATELDEWCGRRRSLRLVRGRLHDACLDVFRPLL